MNIVKLSVRLALAKKDLEEKIAEFDANSVVALHNLVEVAFCYKKLVDRADLCQIILCNIPKDRRKNVDIDLVDIILNLGNGNIPCRLDLGG